MLACRQRHTNVRLHLPRVGPAHSYLACGCLPKHATGDVCRSAQDQCRRVEGPLAAIAAWSLPPCHYPADARGRSQIENRYLCALTIQPAGSLRAAAPLPVLTMMSTYGPCTDHPVRWPGFPRPDQEPAWALDALKLEIYSASGAATGTAALHVWAVMRAMVLEARNSAPRRHR